MAQAYVNGYQPYSFSDFGGGLNLREKADTVGDKEAIDLLNVTFNERGAIRQRDGYQDLTTADLTNRVDSLAAFYNAAGVRHLIAGCGARLEAISTAGAVVASQTGLAGGPYSFARFADPAHEYLYAVNGTDVPQRWDGSAWAAPTATVNGTAASAMPKAGSIAVTASVAGTSSGTNAANRLVATAFGTATTAGPGGTATNPSRVYFSNAGQPEIWETDGAAGRGRNFLDLTPGDGEQIMAAITWRELVFIFKETKFFVMWGESTAADGTPIFNFREVVNNTGLESKKAVTVGRDGVYFLNRRGIYQTNGGDPTLLSDKISPLWNGDLTVYYQGNPINMAQLALSRLTWLNEQLYVSVPTGIQTFNDRTLIYDTQHQWWGVYDLPAAAFTSFRVSDQEELLFGYSTGTKRIGRHRLGLRDDRGTAITSRWRSGWSDYGIPVRKTIRENKAWGSGAMTASFSTDFNVAQTASVNTFFGIPGVWPSGITWGAWITSLGGVWPGAGQVGDKMIRQAVQGTSFSTQFSNSVQSPDWSVHRFVRNLRETRGASVL